jgi:hypothetical protein
LRQFAEFLAARYLLKDGWPLAKVAEIVRTSDVAGLQQLIPSDQPRTPAQEVVSKYRSGHVAASAPPRSAALSKGVAMESAGTTLRKVGAPLTQAAARSGTPLARAADISRRRVSLEENLKSLGNPRGMTLCSPTVRIELTPWCHVQMDASELNEMSEDTASILGAALTQALLDVRTQDKRGK